MFTRTKGFTLIEILVVIAVVGVLSTVVLIAINPIERIEEARDSDRRTKLSAIANALESFAAQNGGLYPSTCYHGEPDCSDARGGVYRSDSTVYFSKDITDYRPPTFAILAKGDDWIPGLVQGGFLKQLPYDELTKKGSRICEDEEPTRAGYLYRSDGRDYKILANCIVSTGMEKFVRGSSTTYGTYCTKAWGTLIKKPAGRMVDPVRWNYAYSLYTPDAACWP